MMLIAWQPSMTFQDITERIFSFSRRIGAIHNISFSGLRQELLATDGLYHALSFHPEKTWNVKPFDIGYVHGGYFVKICNAMDKYKPRITVEKNVEISTVPAVPETDISLFPGGIRQSVCNFPRYSPG
jgi:hypothetical protein